MSGANLFGEYTDENSDPEILEDNMSLLNLDQNHKDTYNKQISELRTEQYQLNEDRKKHYDLIAKLEQQICRYQRELQDSLNDITQNNLMLEECGQKIDQIDNEIKATESSFEGFKECNKLAFKLLQSLKEEKAEDYQKFLKLKEIYDIYIDNINDIIKEIKDEQFQIESENHIANQNAIILQLDKELLEVEAQTKKLKEENEVQEKNYKKFEKEFREQKSKNEYYSDLILFNHSNVKIDENEVDSILNAPLQKLSHDDLSKNCIVCRSKNVLTNCCKLHKKSENENGNRLKCKIEKCKTEISKLRDKKNLLKDQQYQE